MGTTFLLPGTWWSCWLSVPLSCLNPPLSYCRSTEAHGTNWSHDWRCVCPLWTCNNSTRFGLDWLKTFWTVLLLLLQRIDLSNPPILSGVLPPLWVSIQKIGCQASLSLCGVYPRNLLSSHLLFLPPSPARRSFFKCKGTSSYMFALRTF